jgi:hypothetical protein
MSFGLRDVAKTFQRFMDDILGTQINDILIKPTKCVFKSSEVTFLGYKVSAEGSRALDELVAYLHECPPPNTISHLRPFLRMLNFYRRFLSQAAASQAPLHDVLSCTRAKGSHPIDWTPELYRAINECKANLSRAIRATCTRH